MVLESASSSEPPGVNSGWLGSTATDPDPTTDSSSAEGNELVNTNFPPPGMDPKRAAEQLEYMKGMTKTARLFYESDRLLDQEDRVTLYKAFRYQMFAQYGGATLGLVVGLVGPKYVCKYLGRAYKPSYSTLTGLVTVLAGYNLAGKLAQQQNLHAYEGNSKYTNVFKSLAGFPPLIGYGYYQETVRRPDSSFPDPAKFDWGRYPAFPLVLAFFGRYRTDIKGLDANYSPPQGYRNPGALKETPHTTYSQKENLDDGTRKIPSGLDFPSDRQADIGHQPKSESAWDRIRAENPGKFQWEPQHTPHPHPSDPKSVSDSEDPFQEKDNK